MPSPSNDPWARKEAWRYQGPFTRANRFKGSLPGIGIGAGAFILLNVYEYFTASGGDKHH
uniref:ARAD1D16302p n=1 Tax=Blastobotrys adeninivorans TaxID=409370 RepID=A0A060TEN9_BLAAD